MKEVDPGCRAAGTARGRLPRCCTSAVEWVRDVFFYMTPGRPKRDRRRPRVSTPLRRFGVVSGCPTRLAALA